MLGSEAASGHQQNGNARLPEFEFSEEEVMPTMPST